MAKLTDPGVWGVQYDKLGALALEGVKELKADNDNLRAALKASNDNWKRELDEVKRGLRAH